MCLTTHWKFVRNYLIENSKMTYLVKDLTDISLGFSKPHGEQFWALDWDEIGLALIGNCLGQQGFTTTWWSIEQHTLGWGHAKLKEFVWMFHWVLKKGQKILVRMLQRVLKCSCENILLTTTRTRLVRSVPAPAPAALSWHHQGHQYPPSWCWAPPQLSLSGQMGCSG